jgi:hypothetical protein
LHRWKSQTAIELIAARRVENKISSDKTGAAVVGTCDSSMQIGYDWANLRSHMLVVRWSQLQRDRTREAAGCLCIRPGSANLAAHARPRRFSLYLHVPRSLCPSLERRNAPGEITFNRTSPSPPAHSDYALAGVNSFYCSVEEIDCEGNFIQSPAAASFIFSKIASSA